MIPLALLIAGGAGAVAASLKLFSDATARKSEQAVPRDGELIDVDGTLVHYVDKGSGPPIVLIHGLGGQMRNFARVLVDDLARDHRVILVDRPGSGYSVRPKGASAGLAAQAETIAGLIDRLGLERPMLVGHSLGGALSLAVAVHHPQKVGRLALICPLTQTQEEVPEPLRGLAIRSEPVRRIVAHTLAVPMGVAARDKLLKGIFAPEPVPDDFATEGGGALGLRPSNFYNASSDMAALEDDMPRLVARYDEVKAPVAILYGRGDNLLDPEVHGTRMKDMVGADVELVEGGHMLPFTQPELTARWIRAAAGGNGANGGGHPG
ncbi:MAG: alpha/beta fold hydrolase [Allosphingosinicella sp.]|uniref:alpha/beta fold hydrolase n=1 Tax=Allosphingosinicella sp. TaxID=2823234 RepID=UPI00393A205E